MFLLREIHTSHLISWSEEGEGEEGWWWIFRNGISKNWWNDVKLLDVIRPRMNILCVSWMHFGICDACYSIEKSQHLFAKSLGQRRLTDSRYNTKIFQAHLQRKTLPAGGEKDWMDRSRIICKFCEIVRECKVLLFTFQEIFSIM